MLTLILVRHAEASAYSERGDRFRGLTERGLAQAIAAGELIKGWGFPPSLCICSDALRAVQTMEKIAERCGVPQSRVVSTNRLYQSYATQELLELIASAAGDVGYPDADCATVVGHNPDITYKADNLSREPLTAAFPTAGVVALLFDADNWSQVGARTGVILRSSFF